jgi:tetratricopeptide (TPR) repeat protein
MRPLPIYTPSLASHDELKNLFVVREQLLADVIGRVRLASTSEARNHTLLVGPRGSGKTHLISLAYHGVQQLRRDGAITVQTCWLPEDPWAITSYRRLLDSIVGHLEPAIGGTLSPEVEGIEDVISHRSRELGPVVCFAENLDQILDAIGTVGQQRLRHLAQQRVLLFVASTTTLSRDLADQTAPFYGFFTTTRLQPFTVEQAAIMLSTIAAHQGEDATARYLETDQAAARLRAVAHLAGGQPRIWALLAQALTIAGLEELVTMLLTRFDELTPYYQEQLARLSPQQREIVVTLMELDHPANVKEMAEATGIDQRSLAKTVVELRERGWLVETTSPLTNLLDQRRTYYELGEPLARLAFQLKASRGSPIPLIVEFLKNWFEPDDLSEGSLLSDDLTGAYLQQAATGQGDDPVLALTRRLHALPASRVPLLDLIGQLDDACAQLEQGDPEPLLRMPSALRALVEAYLPSDVVEPIAIHTARIRLHNEAMDEFGHFPNPIGIKWLARAKTLITGDDTRASGSAVLADWLGRNWKFTEAEEILAEVTRTEDQTISLTTRTNIATSYRSAGRTEEAIAYGEEILAESEELLGPEHPNSSAARGDLAFSYWEAGRVDEAITLEERVLVDTHRVLGADHPNTFTARGNLASSYQSAGHTTQALALHETNVDDAVRVLGPDHPATLAARNNLADSYRAAGRNIEAIEIEEHLLADAERLLGADHPNTLIARSNLASYYRLGERNTEAITLDEQVLADRERLLGVDHPDTLLSRGNLAGAYMDAGRTDLAIALEERVLADRERLLSVDHPNTRTARRNLAFSYRSVGRLDEAAALE